MYEFLGLIGNFVVVIGLLLLILQVIKSLVPGPYRWAQRIGKSMARFAFLSQAKKRGWLFAAFVHFPLVFSLALLIVGIMTGTWQAALAACVFAVVALLAKRALSFFKGLTSRRRALPGWRR